MREAEAGTAGVRLGALGFLSVALPAAALAAGMSGGGTFLVELLVAAAVCQGVAAGLAYPGFRVVAADRGRGRGRGGAPLLPPGAARFTIFVGSVIFTAVEAYAVGTGIAQGAPRAAAALLLPPLAVAAAALRPVVLAARGVERAAGARPPAEGEA